MAVTAIRTVILYMVLIVAMRMMGKRQIGDLQPVELVVTLLISDLAAVPMQETGIPLLSGLLPILILVALEILLSSVMLKSARFSQWVAGNPVVVVSQGEILPKAMKKLRLTVEDLTENLRTQGVFDLQDVDTAIVETGGKISAYLRSDQQPLRRRDLFAVTPSESIPMVIVSDGKSCEWAMEVCGWDNQRTYQTLDENGYRMSQVFLMTATADGQYTILPKRSEV